MCKYRNSPEQHGFTLIELMVLIAVVAILTTVALPNFSRFVENDRQVAQINSLITAINLARSEAIKHGGGTTTVCAGTTTACTSTAWSGGWAVVYNPPSTAPNATTVLIRTYPALGGSNTLSASPAVSGITFQPNGMTTLGTASVSFKLCDVRGPAHARALDVLVAGSAETSPTPGEDVNGTAFTSCP